MTCSRLLGRVPITDWNVPRTESTRCIADMRIFLFPSSFGLCLDVELKMLDASVQNSNSYFHEHSHWVKQRMETKNVRYAVDHVDEMRYAADRTLLSNCQQMHS
jgi:hypothetical protein